MFVPHQYHHPAFAVARPALPSASPRLRTNDLIAAAQAPRQHVEEIRRAATVRAMDEALGGAV